MLSTKKSSLSHKPKEPAEGLNERRPHGLRDGLRVPWISGEVGPKVEWQSPGGVGITWDNGITKQDISTLYLNTYKLCMCIY